MSATTYADRMRSNPTVERVALAALHAGERPDDSSLSSLDKTLAFISVFNVIANLTKGGLDSVQADAERVWGQLPGQAKRDIAANPGNASGIVAETARTDPAVAARILQQAATQADARATAPASFYDGLGRTPFINEPQAAQ